MTPEQRLDRVERLLGLFVREGRRSRVQSREQGERIDALIHLQESDREVRQAESQKINEKINILINSQMEMIESQKDTRAIHETEMAELRKSQSETDRRLRAFLDSLRKGGNGNSSS
jgi:hypothetical protein